MTSLWGICIEIIKKMNRKFLILAAIFGLTAVILGAFGAHVLKAVLTEAQLESYKTGVQYQFYHTFALLATVILNRRSSSRRLKTACWLFVAGIICFSGSIYLLALRDVLGISSFTGLIGPITPFGGLLFIGGWLTLLLSVWKPLGEDHK